MNTKLLILDWAGTAVDYGCFAPVNAFDQAFRAFGVEATMEEIRRPMGMLKIDHIRTMLAMERIGACWAQVHGRAPEDKDAHAIYGVFESKLMESLEQYAMPKPGVLETVERLRAMGLRIGSTTGYTDAMMEVVTAGAARAGYAPDAWFSPDAVDGLGRPYPYMIYANMKQFRIQSVHQVVKIGDTVSDIQEGLNAGICSLGVIEGSSVLGLTEAEWKALSAQEQAAAAEKARRTFEEAGAHGVLNRLEELPGWLEANG